MIFYGITGKKQLCSMAVGVSASSSAASTTGAAAPAEEKKGCYPFQY